MEWASFLSRDAAWSFAVTKLLKAVLVCICDATFTVRLFVTGPSDQVRKKKIDLGLKPPLAVFVKANHIVSKPFVVLSLSPGQCVMQVGWGLWCQRHTRYSIGFSCAMGQPARKFSSIRQYQVWGLHEQSW